MTNNVVLIDRSWKIELLPLMDICFSLRVAIKVCSHVIYCFQTMPKNDQVQRFKILKQQDRISGTVIRNIDKMLLILTLSVAHKLFHMHPLSANKIDISP